MDDDSVDHFIAQELIASFPISEKISLSTMYIHGKGKNVDLEINLITFNANYVKNKFRYLSQFYVLDLDNTYGLAETVVYKLNDKFDVKGFVNQTISSNNFKWTLGLLYHF